MKFNVTYDIVTEESAEHGDAEERGYICEDATLREAIEAVFGTRTAHCGDITSIEANEYPVTDPRWVSVYNGSEYLTGDYETRAIHLPDAMTPASKLRLCRFLGART